MKKLLPLLLGVAILTGCSPTPAAAVFLKEVPINSNITAVTVPEGIRSSLYAMATELTADYFKLSEKDNQIFSPLSLWYALGVLREGAVDETRAQIEGIMKVSAAFDSAQTIPELSKALNFMVASARAKDNAKNGILLTNGIFFDQRYAKEIKAAYWEKTASTWGAETAQVDFTNEAVTREIIRKWVSDNTETFIDDYEATFATDGSAILNIYNVLYLKDLWTEPFTRLDNEVFHAPTGDVSVPFFGKLAQNAHYHDHAKAQAVSFSGETGIKVWFVLPKNAEPAALIPDLSAILSGGNPTQVQFQAPALDIDGENLSLKELLKSKGYTRLFGDAQLDDMLQGGGAAVTEIKQKTKLQMDENGFKAAAVTEIGVGKTAILVQDPIPFRVDRPYLLVIEYQGLPLFIAQIRNPADR